MAKNIGIFKISGSLGGVTFYRRYGKDLVRRKTSLDKSRIYRDPHFKRTLENCSEFGGCSKVSSDFRHKLVWLGKGFDFACLAPKMLSIFRHISMSTVGARGERGIQLSRNRDLMNNLQLSGTRFDEEMQKNLFSAPYSIEIDDRNFTASLYVPSFKSDHFIKRPQGATHFMITLGVFCVSDYSYSEILKEYLPDDGESEGGMVQTSTEYFPISQFKVPEIRLKVEMDQQICRPGAMNMFVVIGVSFAQKKGETYKLIHKKGFVTLKTRSTCTIQPRREKFNNPYNMPLEHYDWINIDELIKGLGEPEVVMMC